ncbi:hypothetical protein M153_4760002647 [Pseudoloma neurophilia]|uniref:Uncharacterized protein n=1 Tax=Pseudoloma neurophilia TaxID=146866 RepID=A0A0R0M665_9MICR|nr:hypothetical protein M153_4760002647 [Pseudoloma neurophilia]
MDFDLSNLLIYNYKYRKFATVMLFLNILKCFSYIQFLKSASEEDEEIESIHSVDFIPLNKMPHGLACLCSRCTSSCEGKTQPLQCGGYVIYDLECNESIDDNQNGSEEKINLFSYSSDRNNESEELEVVSLQSSESPRTILASDVRRSLNYQTGELYPYLVDDTVEENCCKAMCGAIGRTFDYLTQRLRYCLNPASTSHTI